MSEIVPTYTDLKAVEEEDSDPSTDTDKDSDAEPSKESDDNKETEEDMHKRSLCALYKTNWVFQAAGYYKTVNQL